MEVIRAQARGGAYVVAIWRAIEMAKMNLKAKSEQGKIGPRFSSFHFSIYWPLPVHFILTLDPLEEAGAEPLLDQLGHFASLSASRHLQINSG